MMGDVINLTADVLFNPSEWIGAGKIYKDVPTEVSDAFSSARQLPPDLEATLPGPTMLVPDFIELQLPEILDDPTKFSGRTNDWFSAELPDCDLVSILWSLDIPPNSLLRELEHDFPQKWLNGVKSILDPVDNSLRLPLFALQFYRKIHELRETQEKWTNSVQRVADQGLTDCQSEIYDVFASVSWNTVHFGAPDGQLDWTRLIDDEWLSGGIIDNMMADIQSRVSEIPSLDSTVTVAPLAFQRAIIAFSTQTHHSKYTAFRCTSLVTTGMYSISGDWGWARWQALTSEAVKRMLDLQPGSDADFDDDGEEDYEEPDEGTGTKKRRPNGPRGAVKKQKNDSGVLETRSRKKPSKKVTAGKPKKAPTTKAKKGGRK
ncbi:hypothetical protein B0H11DRAFT_2223709 [Mycena galericulata]|nr:hypothetical protein B0H11DRAFT_2223709 [Mycena galericulata]